MKVKTTAPVTGLSVDIFHLWLQCRNKGNIYSGFLTQLYLEANWPRNWTLATISWQPNGETSGLRVTWKYPYSPFKKDKNWPIYSKLTTFYTSLSIRSWEEECVGNITRLIYFSDRFQTGSISIIRRWSQHFLGLSPDQNWIILLHSQHFIHSNLNVKIHICWFL